MVLNGYFLYTEAVINGINVHLYSKDQLKKGRKVTISFL